MQRVGRVDWRGAAFHIVHVRAFVGDDECAFELAHVRRVDAEVGLQRDVDVHALRHIHERAARPCGGVERAEFVVFRRHDGAEVLLDELGVFAHRGVGVDEDNALLGEVLLDRVVDDLGFVLCRDAGDETAFLRFGDAKAIVGLADVVGQVLPCSGLLADRLDVVLEVLRMEAGKVDSPFWHGLFDERLVPAQAHVEHPCGFALVRRDLTDHLFADALLGGLAGGVRIMPAVRVFTELFDDLVILSYLVFIDASSISHILVHLHVRRCVGQRMFRHRSPPPFTKLPDNTNS